MLCSLAKVITCLVNPSAFQEQSGRARGADKEGQQILEAVKSLAIILRMERD